MHINEAAEFARVKQAMEDPNAIFVFGSNEAGIHGAGAARTAVLYYGAKYDRGVGPTGGSYAIPTKDRSIKALPLDQIGMYVESFLAYAGTHPIYVFVVTRVGCGLRGLTDEDMAPLFKDAPRNCLLPTGWRTYNGEPE